MINEQVLHPKRPEDILSAEEITRQFDSLWELRNADEMLQPRDDFAVLFERARSYVKERLRTKIF